MMLLGGMFSLNNSAGSGFSPLIRTFPPSILENFSDDEMRIFIKKKLAQTKINMEEGLFSIIYDNTQGHPFILTAYLNAIYSKLTDDETEIRFKHLLAADVDFVKVELYPFFSRFYDNASNGSKKILNKIASEGGKANLTELADNLEQKPYKISPYLAKLTQDGALIRTDRGNYKLFHKLFGAYILGTPIHISPQDPSKT